MKFFIGVFIGFVLGTTYPEETRSLVKLAISKTMSLLQDVQQDLGKKGQTPSYDEDYAPLYGKHKHYEESSF